MATNSALPPPVVTGTKRSSTRKLRTVHGASTPQNAATSSAPAASPAGRPARRPPGCRQATRTSASTANTATNGRYSGRVSVVRPSSAPGSSQRHARPPSDAQKNASIAAGSQNSATGSASSRPGVVDEGRVGRGQQRRHEAGHRAREPPPEQVGEQDRPRPQQRHEQQRRLHVHAAGEEVDGAVEQRRARRPVVRARLRAAAVVAVLVQRLGDQHVRRGVVAGVLRRRERGLHAQREPEREDGDQQAEHDASAVPVRQRAQARRHRREGSHGAGCRRLLAKVAAHAHPGPRWRRLPRLAHRHAVLRAGPRGVRRRQLLPPSLAPRALDGLADPDRLARRADRGLAGGLGAQHPGDDRQHRRRRVPRPGRRRRAAGGGRPLRRAARARRTR